MRDHVASKFDLRTHGHTLRTHGHTLRTHGHTLRKHGHSESTPTMYPQVKLTVRMAGRLTGGSTNSSGSTALHGWFSGRFGLNPNAARSISGRRTRLAKMGAAGTMMYGLVAVEAERRATTDMPCCLNSSTGACVGTFVIYTEDSTSGKTDSVTV